MVAARDRECNTEHYEALNGCIAQLTQAQAEVEKLRAEVQELVDAATKVLKWRQGYRELKSALERLGEVEA